MSLLSLCQWLQQTPLSTGIRESVWTFPIIETTHLLSLAVSVGTILFVDLRLVGAGMKRVPVGDLISQLQPWTLGGFVVTFLTGLLLTLSEPLRCYYSMFFNIKLVLLALLGINAFAFHRTVFRTVAKWGEGMPLPPRARMAGYISLTLWMAVIVLGRGIAYTAAH